MSMSAASQLIQQQWRVESIQSRIWPRFKSLFPMQRSCQADNLPEKCTGRSISPALMFPDSGYLRIAPGVLPLSVARERVMTHHDTMSQSWATAVLSHVSHVTHTSEATRERKGPRQSAFNLGIQLRQTSCLHDTDPYMHLHQTFRNIYSLISSSYCMVPTEIFLWLNG